jgi:hypothetical protein
VSIKDTAGLLKVVAWRGGPIALEMALRVLAPSGDDPPVSLQECSKEGLIARSLDLGCRLYLLSLSVPAESTPRGLLRVHLVQELGEAWYHLHQDLLCLYSSGQDRPIRTCLEDLLAHPVPCSPGKEEADQGDLTGRLDLMRQTVAHVWQAAVAGWAA